ncbi:hypothetical protein KIN20_007367 [Parelaphostrongylus tenuis]|uniref:Uncharacterized protein n=1 Tax=Parelaphostrongylus tenuis TaxID=148309 RepID=A0AAD5MP23_PARTN|nr:hypothetical protein KIN20_007367 [Parelaphostrongylus tenuis]
MHVKSLLMVLGLVLKYTSANCSDSQVFERCQRCCALLFSTHECDYNDVLRLKINANGVLGAIWDNSPVAAVVRPQCLLELWELKNQSGSHRTFGLDGLPMIYHFDRYGFEHMASSAKCTCIN